jgi:hypothetical protein
MTKKRIAFVAAVRLPDFVGAGLMLLTACVLRVLPLPPSSSNNVPQAKPAYLVTAWLFGIAVLLMTVLWFQNGVIWG